MCAAGIDAWIDRHGPEAVCAALAPMLTTARIARIDTVLARRLISVVTVVEDTYDPHNAAATMRTVEALGLQELHVIEVEHRFAAAPGVTKGAHDWLDVVRWSDADGAVAGLHARGYRVLATSPAATSTINDIDVVAPIAVMFGNEHTGLSARALRACDGTIAVPMHGMTESFNLSVTVALVQSRLAERRRAYLSATGDLDDARRARLRARWFAAKIRAVDGVLERVLPRQD